MVSKNPNTIVNIGDGTQYFEGFCLSTDAMPTEGVANGSSLIAMDSGDKYYYDAASETWGVPTP